MNRMTASMALAALLMVTIACNMSGAATVTPQAAVSATPLLVITATSTQPAVSPTATPLTSTVPAPTRSEPERVSFGAGATSAALQGEVAENGLSTYLLYAQRPDHVG